MQSLIQATVPVVYVRNIESSKAFYALFGYSEQRSGNADAQWSYLQCGEHTLLLACVEPTPIGGELPLLIYLYVVDLSYVVTRLEAVNQAFERVGFPDHAPGGEVRTRDPDGNVVLVGQRTAMTPSERAEPASTVARQSMIRRAAEAVGRRGGSPVACQIGMADGEPCGEPAEVKLADSWGITVWSCLNHADEALINAPGSFIAAEDDQGLQPWLSRRHRLS